MAPPDTPAAQPLLARFEDYLKYERHYSALTIAAYASDLRALADFTAQAHSLPILESPAHLAGLSPFMVRAWLASQQGARRATLSRKLSSLRAFLRFGLRQGWLAQGPLLSIQLPKAEKRLPKFAGAPALQKLLDEGQFPEGWEGTRDRLVLELLYGCGLRRAELLGLREEDFDSGNRQLLVRGKGNKQRLVPMGEPCQAALASYLRHTTAQGWPAGGVLIRAASGKPAYAGLIHGLVEKYLSQIPALSRHSPHTLRHSFATHMVENGADLNAVKQLLGHASLAATQVYVHNSIDRLRKVYAQAHPKSEKS